MLGTCPECELPVSDKALSCPHCGFPIKGDPPKRRSSKKRMRLPNGFGQISELKGRNLRNPFRAMVTVGTDESGRPICRTLKPKGYFKTYNEAYAALVEYNRSPYDFEDSVTVGELYERWSARHYPTLTGKSLALSYKTAWKRCSSIENMHVASVRSRHVRECIDNAPTPNTKRVTKILLDMMFDYAVEYDMVERNPARAFKLDKEISKAVAEERVEHVSFTDDELSTICRHVGDVSYADAILIQCYMGWRPAELCALKIIDVDLANRVIVGGMKTDSGKGRSVPIHENILPLVKRRYDEAVLHKGEFLFTCPDSWNGILTYSKYRIRFADAMKQLGIEGHKPHDPRKTFVTMCKEAGVDEYAIKYMVGHTISDITESVYTDRSIEWLKNELAKVPCLPKNPKFHGF